MAAKLPMDAFQRRELLHGETPQPGRCREAAREALAAGRLLEALAFFERAEDAAGVSQVVGRAREEGEFFLVQQAHLNGSSPQSPADWAALAERCRARGLWRYAAKALRLAGREADALELEALWTMVAPPAAPGTDESAPADRGAARRQGAARVGG